MSVMLIQSAPYLRTHGMGAPTRWHVPVAESRRRDGALHASCNASIRLLEPRTCAEADQIATSFLCKTCLKKG